MRAGLRGVQTEVSTQEPERLADILPVEGRDYRAMWFAMKRVIADYGDDAKQGAMIPSKTLEEIRLHQGVYRCAEAMLNAMGNLESPEPPADTANES